MYKCERKQASLIGLKCRDKVECCIFGGSDCTYTDFKCLNVYN